MNSLAFWVWIDGVKRRVRLAYPAGTTIDIDACIIGEQPYFDGSRIPGPVV